MASAPEAARALLARGSIRPLLAALAPAGEEARVVGGAVRDAVMGRAVGDIDIATTLHPQAVIAAAEARAWKAVPTGLAHGTVTIVIDGVPYEATTLRRDVETDGRHAVVAFSRDFREDAARRDFTMNALSLDAEGGIHDYAEGIADALAGRVRFMGEPERRIREDYLRALRFFRFRASHGAGAPDAEGLAACGRLKDGMKRLSRERVRQELMKLLGAPGAVEAARAMDGIALWPLVVGIAPDLAAFEALAAAEAALERQPDAVLRLAALAGANAALKDDLKLSNGEAERIGRALAFADEAARAESGAAMRRLAFRAGVAGAQDALLLATARSGLAPDAAAARLRDAAADLRTIPADPYRSADAAALGVAPGPRMGRVLKAATAAWLAAGLPEEADARAAILRRAVAEAVD